MDREITLFINLVNPPKGVGFCLQKGKDELVDYVISKGKDLVFELSARIKEGKDGSPVFLGDYTQGTPKERFVYICSGKRAGQADTLWDRRAKIPLSYITWPQIEKATYSSKLKLIASYEATGKDGGPSCATVPLTDGGWKIS